MLPALVMKLLNEFAPD